ncbi:magnesium transporter [Thermococcus paralvinellae]|uniref:Divalent cation transporter, MgtE-like protein n=1 Tax=Thermococcus paralvinellae TaxID=582419 RepID=W0I831_9EURY|nr:magnesium transporter [Thermococcus paralvinellae]AHF80615.1 divalent cation transporter, MgtE-like protein [Thermococcus paralvinellae]
MTVLLDLKEKLREAYTATLASLIVSLIIGFFGGTFLGKYFNKIRSTYPGILVILPGMMGLRGNVFGSMASRFSTMLYLGDLEPKIREKKVLRNIVIAMILSLIPVTILWFIGMIKGIRYHTLQILLIVISSTILVSLLLGYFTAFVTIFSFKRGTDPDSVAAPLVASMGDLLTIPSLIMFILILESFKLAFWISNLLLIGLLILLVDISKIRRAELLEFKELFIIITLLALLSLISGFTLEKFSHLIQASIILGFAYPSLLSSFGNYGSVIAAKTSTKLHLGEIDKFFSLEPFLEILALFATTPIIGLLINLFGIVVASLTLGISVKPIYALALTYPFMALFIMLYSYTISYFLFKKNIDPDNVAIPLISNNSDIFGTLYAVLIAKLIVGG